MHTTSPPDDTHENNLSDSPMKKIFINTSNTKKQAEMKYFFNMFGYEPEFTSVDLDEPDASQEIVVAYKATKCRLDSTDVSKRNKIKNIFVEDSALYIEGVDESGVNVRWMMDQIEKYEGKKAIFVVLLAYCDETDKVHIYRGEVGGTICMSTTKSNFGFDSNFIPGGSDVTYSVRKDPIHNPRYLAIKSFAEGNIFVTVEAIETWDSSFQK